MDVKLFTALNLPSMRFQYRPEGKAPEITAEAFACWPEHMRREFALLAAEAGLSDRAVCKGTGIATVALGRARETKGLHALSFAEFRAIDDEEERAAANKRRWKAKVRNA